MQHILVIEDHLETLDWLVSTAAEAFPSYVVTPVPTVVEALNNFNKKQYFLLLVDLYAAGQNSETLVKKLRWQYPDARLVVVTNHDDDRHIYTALQWGVDGYLLKSERSRIIVDELKSMVLGKPPISPTILRKILSSFRCDSDHTKINHNPVIRLTNKKPIGRGEDIVHLTCREGEVMHLIAKGCTCSEVASLLGISANTSAGYIKVIYRKLCVSSRAEAVLEAGRQGLLPSFFAAQTAQAG